MKNQKFNQDSVYAQPLKSIPRFVFDEQVARVFPDMIRRSVPGYDTLLSLIRIFSNCYAREGTNAFDLGCSLGASTFAIADGAENIRQFKIYAIDNSKAMINKMRRNLDYSNKRIKVFPVCADIRDIKYKNASVILLNFTLQFLRPEERLRLLEQIYSGLITGGALLISEKIKFDNPLEQSIQNKLHGCYKKFHGYSELEISQKRDALENVLVPETRNTHLNRLKNTRSLHFAYT